MNFLVVDDNESIITLFSYLLKSLGHSSISASNGEEAINKYRTQKPDIVFMDLNMPNKDGFETMEEIRQIDPGANIVFVTAEADKRVVQSNSNGTSTLLEKPLKVSDIKKVVHSFETP